MVKDEEVKRGICIPPKPTGGAPWCCCVGRLVHMLSKLCLLLGDARLIFSGGRASSSYTVWKGTGGRTKKREKCPPLYVTNTYCWIMYDTTQAKWISKIPSNLSDETQKKCKTFAMCISEEVKTLFSCLGPSGFPVLC